MSGVIFILAAAGRGWSAGGWLSQHQGMAGVGSAAARHAACTALCITIFFARSIVTTLLLTLATNRDGVVAACAWITHSAPCSGAEAGCEATERTMCHSYSSMGAIELPQALPRALRPFVGSAMRQRCHTAFFCAPPRKA